MQKINDHYIADTARVLGDVTLGGGVSVWYGAAVRGDVAPVTIGELTNVQDNAVIHCDTGYPNRIGRRCIIGHGAIVHGESVGDETMIGMGAIVLGHARIGNRCLVAAGAVVPPDTEVPDGSLVLGVPGRVVRELNENERAELSRLPDHYLQLARRHHEHPDDPRIEPDAVDHPTID
jgi:carbonic anhydrase/acetyltransferase-like protein (isoleucine patch superfamily)